ncbi:hypothetical protein NST58_23310 [Paenibacillus sp. FSL R10-2796]|uniref:hypothetical protein n=1 Tax=Paenibacillus sp. FSL R10-2796 TaxID=2954663 RepID=UPI0030D9A1ED
MNRRRVLQMTVLIMILVLMFQAGVFAYTNVVTTQKNQTESTSVIKEQAVKQTATEVSINSKVPHSTFEQFVVALNIQDDYRQKIDQMVAAGYSIADICVAYDFLYQNFGSTDDLDDFLTAKTSGKSWEQIFLQYNENHPKFTPRAFNSEELENMMNLKSITSDDIMIGDRLSFVTGKSFKDLIQERLETGEWSKIFVREKVIYSGKPLPRVQITENQIQKYTQSGKLTEQQVTLAFVLAQKVGESSEVVIAKMQQGFSEELIMAQSYVEKYSE